MFSAFINSFKVPELKRRIFFTLGLIFVARVGANIPLPGIDPTPLQNFFADQAEQGGGSLVGMYNMFTGGALLNGAVFALGIMPYISASIVMQLMTALLPALSRLQQEGDTGRQKISQYTRYLTIAICFVQSILLINGLLKNPGMLIGGSYDINTYGAIVIANPTFFLITAVIFLTTGSIIMMWLGEQITEHGIGQGISILITIGIIADLPGAIATAYQMFVAPVGAQQQLSAVQGFVMIALLFASTAGIVMVTQAQRKVAVQYAKRQIGKSVRGGQSSFLPLKVNYAGVMPVIFASALLMFPQQILRMLASATGQDFFLRISDIFNHATWTYYAIFAAMILGFSYFWVSMMFKPIQIADDLKKNGGYVPGVRPGEPTARFLDFVMTRLTLAGAIFLTIIAIFPDFISVAQGIPMQVAIFFGGTGMLITVGVLLDTMRQVETFLLQRHYEGFLEKGKTSATRARFSKMVQTGDPVENTGLAVLWTPLGLLFVIGLACAVLKQFA